MFSRQNFLALLTATFLSMSAHSSPPTIAVEEALETDTSSVTLPASNEGSLLRNNCRECNDAPLRFTHDSKFFVRGASASLEELRAFIKKSGKPRSMTIFHRVGTQDVTRVVVD